MNDDIAAVLARWTGIPVEKLQADRIRKITDHGRDAQKTCDWAR